MTSHRNISQQGYVLILTLVVSAVFLTIGLSMASLVSARYQSSKRTESVENAVLAADAGVTDTLNTLLNQKSFAGYTTAKQLYSDTARGKATYTTAVSYNSTTGLYTVTSRGYAYRTPLDTVAINTKNVEVTATLATSAVSARLAAGSGGLVVNGGKVGGQNLWVNGNVTVTNGGSVGGSGWGWLTPTADATLNVGGYGCGDATNYPIKCTGAIPGAGEPVQISSNSTIYGTVCANGQVTGTYIFPGQGGKGLIINCVAPAVVMPKYDRQGLYSSMTTTKAGFTCNSYFTPQQNLETKTIYTSSITIGNYGNCNPMIKGSVYIRGDLTTTDWSGMTVADTDASGNPITSPPIIAVEGKINIAGAFYDYGGIKPNSYGVGVIFISFNSINATCNSNPACNTLSTADLYNSVNRTTVTYNGLQTTAATSAFYSAFGTVDIQAGTVGAVAGQRVMIESDGTWNNALNGGLNIGSFATGDAFGGKVQLPIWNVITYRQTYS